MNVLDLFSGIGGFSLGLERAGMRTVAFCEIDPYCQHVLAKHWPDVPVFGDVRTLTAEALADARVSRRQSSGDGVAPKASDATGKFGIDVICGGFPCQDISIAGKGAGIDGERSGLWSEYARIIGEVRPRYVIVENVAALLGRGLSRVLGDLAALGFDAEWHCIPASAIGAPHRRDRVWIIGRDAARNRGGTPHESQGNDASGQPQWTWDRASSGTDGRDSAARTGKLERSTIVMASFVANGNHPRLEGWLRRELQERSSERIARPGDSSIPDATCCRRGQGPSDGSGRSEGNGTHERTRPSCGCWWFSEPDVGRRSDGFPLWLDRHIGRGMSDAESRRAFEAMRRLWSTHVAKALWRAAGGLDRIQQAEVLFAFLREYERGSNEARLLVAGQKASEGFLRGLRERTSVRSAPRRPGHRQQRPVEHPDPMQPMSRFLACDSEAAWACDSWEDGIPRVASGIPARVDRLRSLGNAVVPQIPEIIGRAIMMQEGMQIMKRAGEVCAKCKERPRKPGQSYCKECHAEYMVEWRSRGVTLTRKILKKLGLQSIRQ